jgi:DNA-binding beta-propeller fold protein YncE
MYLKFVWLLVFLLCIINALAVQSTAKIYWTSSTGIHRAELDGREHETLLSVTLSDPRSIAVDAVNGKIYWADRETGKIQRTNLDGTDIEDLASTSEASSLRGIAVDPIRGKVYWVDGEWTFRIRRSELDGTSVEDVITSSDTDLLRYPRSIAVDVDAGKIYWTELRTPRIFRVNMDGTNAEAFITDNKWTGLGLPERLSILVVAGRLYWVSYDYSSEEVLIKSANMDGADVKGIINKSYIAKEGGSIYISCIAVDPLVGRIYWEETHSTSETGNIMSANLDGTDAQQLIAVSDPDTQRTPDSIALNVADNKIYWIDSYVTDFGRTSMIRWANLDGTDAEDLINPELQAPCGIDIDASERKIYWTDFGTNKIQRADLDGTHVEDIITTGLAAPTSLALDRLQGKIYWANWKTGDIQRSNIDGTHVETILTSVSARDIAVDAMAGRIYWTGYIEGVDFAIQRADLNGANVQTLIFGLAQSNGIAIDTAQGKICWTGNGFFMTVSRANLDGTAREDVVTYPLDYASAGSNLLRGITVDPDSGRIYWVDCSFGISDSLGEIRGSGITGIINPRFVALGTVPTMSVHVTGKLATLWGRVRQDALLQNFPNPFNPDTWIPFVLRDSAEVEIRIYNVSGALVRTLQLGPRVPGAYQSKEQAAYWDGRNEAGEIVGSGIYFYQMHAGSDSFMRKAVMQR